VTGCGKHTTSNMGANFIIADPISKTQVNGCSYTFLLTVTDRNGATVSLGPARGNFLPVIATLPGYGTQWPPSLPPGPTQ
jgi:hypothetical protein